MAYGWRIEQTGGPEQLTRFEFELEAPAPGMVHVRIEAVGLNYIDTYHRSGLYPVALPAVLGTEAAGEVLAVGEGVTHLKAGDRFAYSGAPGTYASEAHLIAALCVKLPDSVSADLAAASWLKGMTARALLKAVYPVKKGDTVLVHAAAGGVGLILCQWAKALGCTVIGTAGNEAKAALAKGHGADHVILYKDVDFVEEVKALTAGAGVEVVYDGVGKATAPGSLKCLKPRGMLACFGNASGAPDPVSFLDMAAQGSVFVTRPTLFNYIATPEELAETSSDLIDVLADGTVKVEINQRYDLDDVVQAHKDLEARKTTGSTILIP